MGNTVTVETLIDASKKGENIVFMKEDSKKILEMKEYELYLVELDNIFGIVEQNDKSNIFLER